LALSTSSRPHPVSALAVSPNLSHIIVGLADGTVLSFRHVDQLLEQSATTPGPILGLGKLRNVHEARDPITGLGFLAPAGATAVQHPNLMILTTSHVLTLPLSGSSSSRTATVLDDLGAAVGCSATMVTKEGPRIVVAREEAIYVYSAEGREGCYAYEGTIFVFCISRPPSN
jgi:hypothetical protein